MFRTPHISAPLMILRVNGRMDLILGENSVVALMKIGEELSNMGV